MEDDYTPRFVCATSKETSETVCLSSYQSPRGNNDLLKSVKIWEACRATSAASSFFEPIAIGRFNEEFVDGGTGANNPVIELWNQAQLIYGVDPLERKVQCLVSIGTGIPTLKPFRDDILHIGKTLIAIATETERTAERFRRDKTYLDRNNRYFRFNVVRGLEDIGLEEAARAQDIAAATRRYIESQEVLNQMKAFAGNPRGQSRDELPDVTSQFAAFFAGAGRRTTSGQELIGAAAQGEYFEVKDLQEKGVNVNSTDIAGATPFYYAVTQGHPAVVKLLLETGKINVNLRYPAPHTPLLNAIQGGNVEVVRLLLETGKVDVNVKGHSGITPLFYAIQQDHLEIVQELLQTGKVDANAKVPGGMTPLGFTAMQGNEAMVKALLEMGKADVNVKDSLGKTALTWATDVGHESVMKLLKSK